MSGKEFGFWGCLFRENLALHTSIPGIKIVYPFLSALFKLYYSYRMWLSGYFVVFLSTTAKSQKKKNHTVPRQSARCGQSWPYGLLAANFKWFGSK